MFVFRPSPLHFSPSQVLCQDTESFLVLTLAVSHGVHMSPQMAVQALPVSLLRTGLQVPVSAALVSPVEVGWRSGTCALVTVPMPFQLAREHVPIYALSPSVRWHQGFLISWPCGQGIYLML